MTSVSPPLSGRTILVGVTGSIAAFKAAELVSELRKAGAQVVVLLTPHAQKFVAPLTFESLSRNPVVTQDVVDLERLPEHVGLADRADLLVIAPATANILGKAAAGIADDALSTTFIAVDVPVLFAPAMNDRMYRHPAVQANVRRLTEMGCAFLGPAEGDLACGRVGVGRMVEPEEIVRKIAAMLEGRPRRGTN